jgi:hypothetical protein
MRKVSFVATLAGVASLATGCALVAGYDFGKYGEREGEGAGGGATSESSQSGSLSTSGSTSASSTTATSGSSTGSGGSAVTVLYPGPDIPSRLAVDAAAVYFTTSSAEGKVLRVLKDGSSIFTLAAKEEGPLSIAIDATHAYWSSGPTSPVPQQIIKRAPIMGGSVETIVNVMTGVGALTVHGQQIYWTTPSSDTVWAKATGGGADVPLIVSQNNPSAIAADATGIYWVNTGTAPKSDGAVLRAALDGTNVQTLASGQKFPLNLALDAGHVYWTTLDGGLSGIGKDGKNLFPYVVSTTGEPITAVTSDGVHVYYIVAEKVFKVPVGSLSAEVILDDDNYPSELALDATSLYVAERGSTGGSSRVIKLSK